MKWLIVLSLLYTTSLSAEATPGVWITEAEIDAINAQTKELVEIVKMQRKHIEQLQASKNCI